MTNLRLTLVLAALWVLILLKMSDESEQFAQWSEDEILNELRYLLAENFIQVVERNGDYYFVINDEVDEV